MGNFNQGGKSWGNRDNRGGGGGGFRGGFGGGGRGGFGDRPRPQMHRAICSDCGQECEVPFKPTGEKPVYCSNCFEGSGRGMSRPKRDDGPRNDRPRFDDKPKAPGNQELKEQFDKLNAKLDRLLKILAPVMPTEAKPKEAKKVEEVAKEPAKPAKKAVKKVAKKTTKKAK